MSNSLSYKIDDCIFCSNSDDYFEFSVIINGFKIESKFYGKTYYLYIDDEMIQEWPLVEDDFRCCKVGDPKGEAAYNRALSKGCCGFYDEIIEHPKTKVKYKIGFNYGH